MASIPAGTDPCSIPVASLPAGQEEPHFVNPPSQEKMTIGISIVLLVLTTAFVTARISANWHNLRWPDWFTLFAFASNTANIGIIMSLSKYSRHQWDMPMCWILDAGYLKGLYAQMMTYAMALLFSKAAIFLLYLQIFGIKASMHIAVYIGLAFNALLYTTFIPTASIFSAPRPGRPWVSIATEDNSHILASCGVVIGVSSVILDVYILVLPLPIIYHLATSSSRRLQLAAVFGAALAGVVASIISLVYRVKLLQDANDRTWNRALVVAANAAENSVALIVGSAPAFSTFFRKHVAGLGIWKMTRPTFLPTFGKRRASQDDTNSTPSRHIGAFSSTRTPITTHLRNDIKLTGSASFSATASAQYNRLDDEITTAYRSDGSRGGIIRTLIVSQEVHRHPESTDRLV
ncbi:hypothetical protein GGR52DRAFT_551635 [Hypoxylon sp. FL1284]|nr:hypothetical protein GGR52DRAFT_551635 [Hypoxylon sp. FL1284]